MKITELNESLKRLGPDMNDPYEQGWFANYDDPNPYEKGTSEHAKWQDGYEERRAQPNHYDESVEEAWSQKYKRSIDCSHPKGFSQRAHCAGKKKHNESVEMEMTCPHCNGELVSEELINEKKDACYYKVKSRYKVWPSAYASGALVTCRKKGAKNWGTGDKKNESIEELEENLHKWFKEKWVRFGPDGKIRGDCARGSESEGKPKCLPQSKAHSLGKKARASAASRKRREDPNPERTGKAINVNTKKKSNEDVTEGVAETMSMNDAMKVLRQYGVDSFKTTSNELHFYKNGRPMSIDLIWNDGADRSVSLSQLNSATRKLKGQGVAESFDYSTIHSARVGDEIVLKNPDYRGVIVKLGTDGEFSFKNESDGKRYKGNARMIDRNLSQEKRYKEVSDADNKRFSDAMARDQERIDKSGALKKFGIGETSNYGDLDESENVISIYDGNRNQYHLPAKLENDFVSDWNDFMRSSHKNDSFIKAAHNFAKKYDQYRVKSEKTLDEVAPPGEEKLVRKLKKEYPGHPEKAFATAWSIYNKKHGKK